MTVQLYDVLRKTTSFADGVSVPAYAHQTTAKFDLQPVQWSQRESTNRAEVEVGGVKFVPTFYGYCSSDIDVTATDRLTPDSGTTLFIALRVYDFEDHKEIDIREAEN